MREIGLDKLDLVKIDVEGHELNVLRGMVNCLALTRPFVFWEFGPTTLEKFANQDAVLDAFPENYAIYYVGYKSRWSRSDPLLREFNFPETGNLLAVPQERSHLVETLLK